MNWDINIPICLSSVKLSQVKTKNIQYDVYRMDNLQIIRKNKNTKCFMNESTENNNVK